MGPRPFIKSTLLALAAGLLLAGAASAGLGVNPANHSRLLGKAIEPFRYDPGRKCRDKSYPGMQALVRWLERHTRGDAWGTYRCEKWGKGRFSVHAEGRAIDWRMDARDRDEKRQAMKLIRKRLLAEDRQGNRNALARRMGIQGIIFNCRAWFSDPGGLGPYDYCYKRNGARKPWRKLNPTVAHVDHIHIELNKPGARRLTSFWRSGLL